MRREALYIRHLARPAEPFSQARDQMPAGDREPVRRHGAGVMVPARLQPGGGRGEKKGGTPDAQACGPGLSRAGDPVGWNVGFSTSKIRRRFFGTA